MKNNVHLKKFGFAASILIFLLLPVIGYVIMRGAANIIPQSNTKDIYYFLYILCLLIPLLIIPYVMLKFLFHAIHIKNNSEPELHLDDLPKTQKKNKN